MPRPRALGATARLFEVATLAVGMSITRPPQAITTACHPAALVALAGGGPRSAHPAVEAGSRIPAGAGAAAKELAPEFPRIRKMGRASDEVDLFLATRIGALPGRVQHR